jgi:hypothetical protein
VDSLRILDGRRDGDYYGRLATLAGGAWFAANTPAWLRLMQYAAQTSLAAVPIAVGFAVLRYRLYDVDLLINRTLVYGSLTFLLAATYAGIVISLQYLLRALTGQESTLAVVASTLAIAALFDPLRRRVQTFVDRLFYRRKCDAARILEGLSAGLRDETDLATLSDRLLGVVSKTMQPSHASLWLRPDRAPRLPRRSWAQTFGCIFEKARTLTAP